MSYLKYIVFISWLHVSYSQFAPVVNTTQGLVRGLVAEDGDYYMYLGIPYGTVDSNNPFGPSSPTPEFQDIFNAIDDSAACPQPDSISTSLDCLHLNVFIPRTRTNLLPVLVHIHGGAFEFGAYGRYYFGPRFLVRHDVILITFNYRLGAFGYMCTDSPRAPGNQGSKDQLLALRWVRDNVESFGGDPKRVTLSGNSAGAMSTDLIIASDKGDQYFHQAIMQSGVSLLPDYRDSSRYPFYLAEYLGLSTNNTDVALDFLASIDPMQIISASQELNLEARPCIERVFEGVDAFITENWVTKEVVRPNGVNIMIGFNENEALGLFLMDDSDLTNVVDESLRGTFATEHEDFTGQSEVRNFFFGDEQIDDNLLKEAIDLRSDTSFVHNSIRSIQRYLRSGVENVYLYLFYYDGERNFIKPTLNTTLEGAAHADEITYLYDISYFDKPNSDDQLILDRMTEMWTNFVKYGDPTPQPTTLVPLTWQPITSTSPYHYLHIDSQLQVDVSPNHERMAFWDLFYELNGHLQRIDYLTA